VSESPATCRTGGRLSIQIEQFITTLKENIMNKTYETPAIVTLGDFAVETGFGIGGQAEGWNPIADRKN